MKRDKNAPNVPTLRFCEFTLPWERIELKSIIKEIKQYTSDFDKYPLYSFTIENGVTPKTDRYERNFLVTKEGDTFKVVPPNTFVMNPMNLRFGAINYSKLDFPVSVSGYYNIFEIENGKNNDFWAAYFLTKSAINLYNSVATGSLIEKKRVHFSQFIGLKFLVPTSKEKEKITYFIRLIDKRLAVQNKIIEDYSSLKKSIIDNFFNELTNSSLGEHIIEITERNGYKNEYEVLSVSNKYGFIKQNEQFEDRIIASENKSNYKVVRKNTFAYNPTRINVGSIACMHYLDIGIVSPMYLCFSTLKTLSPYYLEYYFLSKSFKLEMNKKLEGSVRMCLQIDALKKIKLYIPSLEIQNKFVNKLSCFDKKIQKEKDILSLYKKQKAYLLQNMFI